jgi:hypothetical protein
MLTKNLHQFRVFPLQVGILQRKHFAFLLQLLDVLAQGRLW